MLVNDISSSSSKSFKQKARHSLQSEQLQSNKNYNVL